MNQVDDIEYVLRILNGDTSAYAALVDRHKNMAFSLALKIAGKPEEAEEIAMDAFVKAFNNLSTFRQESQFKTWLYRIVYNTAITFTRKKKHEFLALDERLIEQYPDPTEAINEFSKEDQFRMVEKAIQRLSPEDGLLITLFYKEELSIDEVSSVTGLTVSNVKVKLHRIRKKIANDVETSIKKELKEEYI
jgi:RNA polymerase sigma-70 factor (ECF subfamily)